ncbi:radical SAM family heme chaperone HemW [Bacillus cytotoxicus]|uniref:radical SAM family heme chaperone HemW n=1 Tax=Bacillus cereus group TaxID=86661 RepID=UPI000B96DA99|nr:MULTISPECIES: radical SAM family heme chaperone HemW [Bacillus cereus group]AWC33913.1 coproporphyrinogen III oxidase [Bacillus cytotoxicus]AWC37911.1 coproporphyrinogen III oxidase [Bacillus cytotoxicus]AWC62126.1 coproporphyrinogen III oxidase [Bacillus cytotoxicus]MDH2882375.1 radical SAM family heme chaperone HemW [Bacillus cytotoxicus]QTR70321.1 oxygen-independent coproporphyrinogen III oxidase [Bacillus cytotoxicus]
MMQAAYIHIPFCQHICHYCDFNKVFIERQPVDQYLEYLEKEIVNTVQKVPFKQMKTIFVGGGTPTALNMEQTKKLLDIINRRLRPFAPNCEVTFEANPGDLPKEKLNLLLEGGVNRISFGVQTFRDELLEKIGRKHTREDAFVAIREAQEVGFANINIDLIYALPGQTIEDVKETLNIAFTLGVQHFSAYSLIVEPKTVFYNLMNKGKLRLPGEEHEAKMYEMVMDEMEKHGYHQYEISNFAKEGHESRHNLTYWNNEAYYGFGAGAHSYINGERIQNVGPLKQYFAKIDETGFPYLDVHQVTEKERMEEELFLGLRKTKGVLKKAFQQKFGVKMEDVFANQLAHNKAHGLLEEKDGHVCLTRTGKLLGNEVFQSFLVD